MKILVLGIAALLCFPGAASAKSSEITESMITQKYAQLEKALNSRDDYAAAIKVMHEQISEDARFQMTVTNPIVGPSGKSPVMEMSKEDYINTYIQGTHSVENYHLDIKTSDFKYDASSNSAYTVDILTETGNVPTMTESEKPFVSRTKCVTRHEMRGGELQATGSQCHTNISFEEDI